MRAKLVNRWRRIRSSYWLIPALLTLSAVAMAALAHQVDQSIAAGRLSLGLLAYGGGASGARAILSTLAGSMITVAGVAFSTTMVALVLASSEFGPRLLEHFIRDRGNQVVLGSFICTFLYCVLGLLAVRGTDAAFVPRFTVNLGILLSVVSVGLFIYFIHHVIQLIQAPNVVSRVGQRLDAWVDGLFPDLHEHELGAAARAPVGEARTGVASPARPSDHLPEWCGAGRNGSPEAPSSRSLEADRSGYLQTLDHDHLVQVAEGRHLVVELRVRPGDFLRPGDELALLHCVRMPDDDPRDELDQAFVLGDQRTPAQDPEFVVDQLVELAVRALSSGTNDPYTAINCIDRLGAALGRVARRPPPPERVRGPGGRIRLLRDPIDFPELACAALDPIREYGRGHSAVLIRLLDTVGALSGQARRPPALSELRWHAEKIVRSGQEGIPEETGVASLESRFRRVRQRIREREEGIEVSSTGPEAGK